MRPTEVHALRWLTLLAAALPAVAMAPATARAYCRMSTAQVDDGEPDTDSCCNPGDVGCSFLRWTRGCISVAIDERGAADFTDEELARIVEVSFNAWLVTDCGAGPTGISVRRLAEPSLCAFPEYNPDGGNVNAITFVENWKRRGNEPNAFALTTVWHSTETGQIFDADMEINEDKGPYGVCPSPEGCRADRPGGPVTVDLQNVLTHEFGHFFGLGHTDDPNASMYARSPPGEVTRRLLRPDDQEGYCETYPSPLVCSGTPSAFTPRGGLNFECGGGGSGGCSCETTGERDQGLRSVLLASLALLGGLGLLRLRRRG